MKFLIITIILLFNSLTYAADFRVAISEGKYKINTQDKLKVLLFEVGLECKVYSKLRILGTPAKITYRKSEFFERFEVTKSLFGKYTVKSENDTYLVFGLSTLMSYVHACSVLTNIDATINGKAYSARELSMGDFSVTNQDHNFVLDFNEFLKKKTLYLNSNLDEISFK